MLLYTRFWEFDLRDLVAALVPIVAGCPAARLLVVGRGERGEERELLRLAERAGVAAAIDYRGWVEPARDPGAAGVGRSCAGADGRHADQSRALAWPSCWS